MSRYANSEFVHFLFKELKKTEYQVIWTLEGNGGLNAYERIYIVQYIHLSNVLKDAYFKS